MVGLTSKQQEDLNFAILQYLNKNEYSGAADAFTLDANVDYDNYL